MRRGWFRAWEPATLFVSVAVLFLLTWQVSTEGAVTRLDDRVYGSVGVVGSPLVTVLSALGSPELAGAVLGVVALHHAFFAGQWWPVALAAGNAVAAAGVVLAMKVATARPGPGVSDLDGYPGYFPSGHTVTAAVCFGTAGYILAGHRWRDASAVGVVGGLGSGAAVGTATVLSGTHWVSDAAAGLAVAVVVLVVGFATARRPGTTASGQGTSTSRPGRPPPASRR